VLVGVGGGSVDVTVGVGVIVFVGVGVTDGMESQIDITDPALPPLPAIVKDVKDTELFIVNCPAPQPPQIGSQSLFILLAVITFPEIDAQHPEHKIISGVLFPVFVVITKDSGFPPVISYPSKVKLKLFIS
jgi:hypothetical protein